MSLALGKYQLEILRLQRREIADIPAMHATWKHQQGALMRHAGKAEAAIAIGINGCARRVEGVQGLTGFAFASSFAPSRFVPRRMRTGEAIKIEE